ncbi:ribonuclease III [Candidatus Uhrbacteria bacterium CG_4_9_14_3_um_filter_36_7]|uniref:Ribonuclease 3 n=1 Tax=Candidatus Uhrbacteria bacterium CG_4_9_14_3_um_filter_36_7 TaxID=1975033 RepID=A0A2M7XHE6_9BACT|nr:MAG: ribonuclease III [Candidatus Uhrbacteria bacterium CG_4_9_14_3_um_filter_36_7]
MREVELVEQALGVIFHNKDTLRQALVHRSYLNEHPDFSLGHNERLEFLGDAVLELVVTEYLFAHYENPEGELTNWRAALVNADMLSLVCQRLGIEEELYLSKGESKEKNSKARYYILANAFEALIGAIYLDQGWESAKDFIMRTVMIELPRVLDEQLYIDPKSRFQELVQEKQGITPTYKVLNEEGPDHEKLFEVGVYIGKEFIAKGTGTSKHEAQIEAAKKAIEQNKW